MQRSNPLKKDRRNAFTSTHFTHNINPFQLRSEAHRVLFRTTGKRTMVGKSNCGPQTAVARRGRGDVRHAAGGENCLGLGRTARVAFEVGMKEGRQKGN